jgi:hypothetical protein
MSWSKRLLNTATHKLKQLPNKNKNDCIHTFLQQSTEYSLWKATKKIKQVKKPSPLLRTSQGILERSSVEEGHAFTKHLAKVFQPHPSENKPEEAEVLIQLLETPYQLDPPINRLKRTAVKEVINSLIPK